MQLYAILGAGLMALLVMAWPALTQPQFRSHEHKRFMRPGGLWDLVTSELGVTITYLSQNGSNNTTTPPTAAEASLLPMQAAQVFWADTDTEAIVIHNWGSRLGPSFASFGFPVVVMNKLLGAVATSFRTDFTFGLASSSRVFITKPIGTGTGGTFLVSLFLPHSIIGGPRT